MTGERAAPLLERPVRNRAGGEWTEPTGEGSRAVVNPATGERIAETPFSSEADVDAAVQTTREGINVGTAAPMVFFHFRGQKDSFFGDLHAQAEDVIRFYTDETVYIERWPDAEADGTAR